MVTLLLTSALAGVAPAQDAKLIEFGWDEPDTQFMREHIREMEQTPFDGCVFHLTYPAADGSQANFTWECWGEKAFDRDLLWPAVDDLRALDSDTFTENLLRFNVTPGGLDWFDDFSAVVHNARLAAEIAKAGGCPGILFDIESYGKPLWHHQSLRDKDTKSWDEYAAQVRTRGAEVMEAFQEPYPSITIFLTFGYCLPWVQAGGSAEGLPDAHYGLLAPFIDGMIDAAGDRVTIVDGFELSYRYRELAEYKAARKMVTEDLLPIAAGPAKYAKHLSLAFGIWMDADWRTRGWAEGPFTGNVFLPMQFRRSVESAFAVCDDYVWVYTETPRWWSAEGPQKLPRAYQRALREAKESARR